MRYLALVALFLSTSAMTLDNQGDMTFTPEEQTIIADALTSLGKTGHPMAEEAQGAAKRLAHGLDRRSFGVVMIALSKAAYEGTPACEMIKKMSPQAVCMK